MAQDTKYGRITCERGNIGEDEPVVIFRAQDATLPDLLDAYRAICVAAGSPTKHLASIDAAKAEVMAWQKDHPTQIPQSANA